MITRWEQRFSNYRNALKKLRISVSIIKEIDDYKLTEDIIELQKEGLIQRFEYTHELAWKVMKDFVQYQGTTNISGSRDVIRQAFSLNLIHDGQLWMQTIAERNLTTHTYNKETADRICKTIIKDYLTLFVNFEIEMASRLKNEHDSLL